MIKQNRLGYGGRINREKLLRFSFNGKMFFGFQGDTLASALIANGIGIVGRSLKYHRPRGIVAAGSEEPNAIIQIGSGANTLPNQVATQVELFDGLEATTVNSWPSLNFDVKAVLGFFSRLMPPGFYYKTFMWPKGWWMKYERLIRNTAGLGVLSDNPDLDRYEKVNFHCDVLVIGAGPAGLSAALEAGRTGARVLLVDEQNEFGGSLLSNRQSIDGLPASEWISAVVDELIDMQEVRLLPRATAFGYYDHNFVTALERVNQDLSVFSSSSPSERLWRIRANQVVIATGAIERPLVFGNNDRPGVMLASAISTYLNRYAVVPGSRVVVFTNNDSSYQTVLDMLDEGVSLEAVVDVRPNPVGTLIDQVQKREVEIFKGHVVVNVNGSMKIDSVDVMQLDESGSALRGKARRISCDLLAMSGGWNPTVHLHTQSGGTLRFDETKLCFVPDQIVQMERLAGSSNGNFDLTECLIDGSAAGALASRDAGFGTGQVSSPTPLVEKLSYAPTRRIWIVPSLQTIGRGRKQFVDFQTDTTVTDIAIASREGYRSVEHVKRYTTLGMGTDQGKLGNVAGIGVLSNILHSQMSSVGTTTFRPPYTPVRYGAIAGRGISRFFDPVRKTPLHYWHERFGAQFENVGQWKRAWYYPEKDEDFQETINRESLMARHGVAITDASTLGKIDIQGPDAAKLLNRVYTNAWLKLPVGRCRYGLMLGEDGMLMDDGVTARLAENHYLMHTTTGNAASVMAWLDRWIQTEWPDLEVYLTSVTEHWATLSIVGPLSRAVVGAVCDDIDFSNDSFPFMSVRSGTVSGVPARIFRISFSGELTYEINVQSNYARGVWEACLKAGEEYGIKPYGTEVMHVLRAEKGFVIIGQDTDGSVTPMDAGMNYMVNRHKDFLGKRSLYRSEMLRDDRKQLVGLRTCSPVEVLPEGGQIVESANNDLPAAMLGHVTSSYYSASMGHSIALALVMGGRSRMGDVVYIFDTNGGFTPAEITNPVFYDPDGERQNV